MAFGAGGNTALTPGSASTAGSFPSPPAGPYQSHPGLSGSGSRHAYSDSAGESHHDDDDAGAADGDVQPKKRQKRNKPTLSCQECVERKTKVSR